jgi:hypothetical protein
MIVAFVGNSAYHAVSSRCPGKQRVNKIVGGRTSGRLGKRSNFERHEADFYPTPRAAVVPLIPQAADGVESLRCWPARIKPGTPNIEPATAHSAGVTSGFDPRSL